MNTILANIIATGDSGKPLLVAICLIVSIVLMVVLIMVGKSGKNEEVVQMTSALAKLLRQSISNEDEIVTVEREIEYTRNYLAIQKLRYRDQLEYIIDIDEEVLHRKIVKLVIQPNEQGAGFAFESKIVGGAVPKEYIPGVEKGLQSVIGAGVVAVGRGAKSEQNRAMAKALADALGGVIACTRPLVEENIFDAKQQIGLSGRTVKPKLIICLGISGAVQFAAGMKSSDCIIAVNTDKHAPIFDVAHYGIVGDLNEIVPLLLEKINAKENGHV